MPRLSAEFEDEVPPVPPLPAGVAPAPRPLSGAYPMAQAEKEKDKEQKPNNSATERDGKEAREGKRSSTGRSKRGVDVEKLLGSIDAVAGGERRSGGRPPY